MAINANKYLKIYRLFSQNDDYITYYLYYLISSNVMDKLVLSE